MNNMNKSIIKVPYGIKYISDWEGYCLPKGHIIVDKGVTGCGYTEYCLRNSENVILCSPRRLLLENKAEQHQQDRNILYLENEITDNSGVQDLMAKISGHLYNCQVLKKPVKFMITYDSSHYLIDYLLDLELLDEFYLVADEFQSIFLDSYYKVEVENDFLDHIQICQNVIYLSATPMLDKYLEMLDEFKDLDYQVLDWSESGYVENVRILRKCVRSLFPECKKVIERFKKEEYETIYTKEHGVVESKEAVLYFNSVTEITRVIKAMDLSPDEVNILCSKTPENKDKLDRLSRQIGLKVPSEKRDNPNLWFTFGRVPLYGEQNKKYTFATRSVYMGADLHSFCASTFVFADPNYKHLALDISLDLPQIAGRQRDRENPFKNNITLFYKTTKGENLENREEFDDRQSQKKQSTNILLSAFSKMSDEEKNEYLRKLKNDVESSRYSDDFVSISKTTNLPVYNRLIEVSSERAWEVVQKDYQDKIAVTRSLNDLGYEVGEHKNEEDKIVSEFLDEHFYKTGIFAKKMEMYCEFMDQYKDNKYIYGSVNHKITDPRFKSYYDFLGTDRCKAMKFRENEMKYKIDNAKLESNLIAVINNYFKVGNKYTRTYIKEKLQEIYEECSIVSKSKATDIEKFFTVQEIKLTDPISKKRDRGYLLVSRKL